MLMKRILPDIVAAILGSALLASAILDAQSTVQSTSQTSPSSGQAGITSVTLHGAGFPAGTLDKDYMTVWLTPSCGGPGSTTTVPTSLTGTGGSSYDIQFTIPRYLLTNTFYVTVSGTTTQGTGFTSANCSQIAVTGVLPTPVVDVTVYGADPTGTNDSTVAIMNAIAAAQANGGGTVYFPAGSYHVGIVGTNIAIKTGPAITLAGAGMNQSTIVETVLNKDLLGVNVDGMVVEDLGFDTATYAAGHCIGVVANNTTLERVKLVSGTRTFAIYYAGPPGAKPTNPIYNTGNQMLDSIITDSVNDDGFSYSFQQNGVIRNIIHTGSRLALYVDKNVTVTDYQYSPNTESGQNPSNQNGFWITPPSDSITIRNFVSRGQGGIIGQNTTRISTNIAIIGEQLLDTNACKGAGACMLQIGDVNGLTVQNGSFVGDGSGLGKLRIYPDIQAINIQVNNVTLQQVTFVPVAGALGIQAAFNNDIYEPFNPEAATFQTNNTNAPVSFTATGGQFCNAAGGFQSGPNTTYTNNVGPCADSQVSTTASGLAYSRVSQTYNGTVTIKNTGNSTLAGPLQIVFTSLTAGVTVVNATGTFSGSPFLTVPGVTSLASGQSATVSVQFKNPSNGTINFIPVIFSGSL